jgi:hypothetical protein
MPVVGRRARARANNREHAERPRFLRRICFGGEPPGTAKRAMSEGV